MCTRYLLVLGEEVMITITMYGSTSTYFACYEGGYLNKSLITLVVEYGDI